MLPTDISKLADSVGVVVSKHPISGEYGIGTGFVAYRDNIVVTTHHDEKHGFKPVAFLTKDRKRYGIARHYTPALCQGVCFWETYLHTGLPPLPCAASAEATRGESLYTIGLVDGNYPIITSSLFHRAPEGRGDFYMFANLTPGSCGSPVINAKGMVLGVYRAHLVDSPGYQLVSKIQNYNLHMGFLQTKEFEWEWA